MSAMRIHRISAVLLLAAGASIVAGKGVWAEPPEPGATPPAPAAPPRSAAPQAPHPKPPPTAPGGDEADPASGDDRELVVPLQARDVIERLKAMRAQLLLDEEYNRLLEARVKRQELEVQLGLAQEQSKKRDGASAPSAASTPPLRRTVVAVPAPAAVKESELTVKSVTVAPFKEAFVVYRGRTYTVRPGDKLGDITIRDVTENGVLTNTSSVMLER